MSLSAAYESDSRVLLREFSCVLAARICVNPPRKRPAGVFLDLPKVAFNQNPTMTQDIPVLCIHSRATIAYCIHSRAIAALDF